VGSLQKVSYVVSTGPFWSYHHPCIITKMIKKIYLIFKLNYIKKIY
jgi:hypothetical protein